MIIEIYSDITSPQKLGTLTITLDRITAINIKVHIGRGIETFLLEKETGKKISDYIQFSNDNTQFPFLLARVSKGDLAYRKLKLTYKILCNGLNDYIEKDHNFLFKPTLTQRISLFYNLKKFFWQTQDFKTHIYKYVATSFISAAIGVIGTLIIVRPLDKIDTPNTQKQTQQLGDTLTHQPIHKTGTPETVSPHFQDTSKRKETSQE